MKRTGFRKQNGRSPWPHSVNEGKVRRREGGSPQWGCLSSVSVCPPACLSVHPSTSSPNPPVPSLSLSIQVLQNILETEIEYSKKLQNLLTSYLHSLQPTDTWVCLSSHGYVWCVFLSGLCVIWAYYEPYCTPPWLLVNHIAPAFPTLSPSVSRLSSADVSHILGNLEDISTFQLMLVQSYEECTKWVPEPTHTPYDQSSIDQMYLINTWMYQMSAGNLHASLKYESTLK